MKITTEERSKMEKNKPEIRYLKDLKKVIYDWNWLKSAENFPVYYMYRGIKKRGSLRYDITIIPPKMLGKEFVKTQGNCNSKNFQELYTVLRGKVIFLMQKMKGRIVKDIMAVRAGRGAWVIVPPKYYVVSINPSKNILELGNWVSEKNKNIYKDLEARQGACYYLTKSGWIKNKNYGTIPKLRFEKPLKSMPKDLGFLKG